MTYKQSFNDKDIKAQNEALLAENIDLLRRLDGRDEVQHCSDCEDMGAQIQDLLQERDLTPEKLGRLTKQADCGHHEIVEGRCLACSREIVADEFEKTSYGLLTAMDDSGGDLVSVYWIKRLGQLLRATVGCSKTEQSDDAAGDIRKGVCVRCGKVAELCCDICVDCHND